MVTWVTPGIICGAEQTTAPWKVRQKPNQIGLGRRLSESRFHPFGCQLCRGLSETGTPGTQTTRPPCAQYRDHPVLFFSTRNPPAQRLISITSKNWDRNTENPPSDGLMFSSYAQKKRYFSTSNNVSNSPDWTPCLCQALLWHLQCFEFRGRGSPCVKRNRVGQVDKNITKCPTETTNHF